MESNRPDIYKASLAAGMGKNITQQLKGIAVLAMLWLHLFSDGEQTAMLVNAVYLWNGEPLAVMLKRICSMCVPVYIFLGGYGLSVVREKAVMGTGGVSRWRRVLSLYANAWTVFLMFYPLGLLFNPGLFDTGASDMMLNAVGLKCSMNGSWWFLLPYIVLTFFSDAIIKCVYASGRKKEMLMSAASLVLYVGAYVGLDMPDALSADVLPEWASLLIVNVLRVFSLQFMFIAGILFAKHRIPGRWHVALLSRWRRAKVNAVMLSVMFALLSVRLVLGSSSLIHPWFVMVLVPCYAACVLPRRATDVLEYFGRHSTNIWLVHEFFAHYVFGAVLYSLRYPVLIWLTLVCLSTASSYIVSFVYTPIRAAIRRK